MMTTDIKNYVVGVAGASGSIYAKIIISALLETGAHVYLTLSPTAKQIWAHEIPEENFQNFIDSQSAKYAKKLHIENFKDVGARIASGSFRHDGMIIVPCSVKTLSGVAHGYAASLIERAADVCLKERFPLVLVVRETPFSLIHLENMTSVTKAGAVVLPACPAFYHGDNSLEGLVGFVAGKTLDVLRVPHNLFHRWKDKEDIQEC